MSIELIGDKQLFKALLELTNDSAIRVMRPSISKALTPVKRQAKQNVKPHRQSGLLNKAISKKAGGKRRSSKAWGKIYIKSKPATWEGKKRNPVRYAHFLEFGTRNARAHPFMRTAMASSKGQVAAILAMEGRVNLAKFAGKLRKRYDTMSAMKKAGARFLR
jgi:HK97 gp10 family phage protein